MSTPTTAPTVRPLTTREAEALIEAAVRAAEGLGVRGSVTVLDAGGQLLGFRRDDSAVLISGETSTRKAYTALQLDAPTADLVDLVRPDGLFHTLPTALDRPLLFLAGGAAPPGRPADRRTRLRRRRPRTGPPDRHRGDSGGRPRLTPAPSRPSGRPRL